MTCLFFFRIEPSGLATAMTSIGWHRAMRPDSRWWSVACGSTAVMRPTLSLGACCVGGERRTRTRAAHFRPARRRLQHTAHSIHHTAHASHTPSDREVRRSFRRRRDLPLRDRRHPRLALHAGHRPAIPRQRPAAARCVPCSFRRPCVTAMTRARPMPAHVVFLHLSSFAAAHRR